MLIDEDTNLKDKRPHNHVKADQNYDPNLFVLNAEMHVLNRKNEHKLLVKYAFQIITDCKIIC